jgi:4-diphosphocytidyl-2-C-methyl-D-erythritol kinase
MLTKRLDENKLEIHAPAKVNLFLEVLSKRSDGYHNINSLFQAVSLYDRLEFTINDKPGVKLELIGCDDVAKGENNLVCRAYNIMRGQFNLQQGLDVRLDKQIPVAAGLGGGSADGAAAILACNLLFDLKLTRSRMAGLSLEIGSDLPFFFSGGQALVSGRGEVVEPLEVPTDYTIVLANPGWSVSTAEAYRLLKMDLTKRRDQYTLPPCRDVSELFEALRQTGNDFEEVLGASYPVLDRIRNVLLQAGAVLTRLSGSGPTMFGLFVNAPGLEQDTTYDWGCWRLFTVKPITWPLEVV